MKTLQDRVTTIIYSNYNNLYNKFVINRHSFKNNLTDEDILDDEILKILTNRLKPELNQLSDDELLHYIESRLGFVKAKNTQRDSKYKATHINLDTNAYFKKEMQDNPTIY